MADNMWGFLQPLFARNGIEDQPSDLMRKPGPGGYDYNAWWNAMQAAAPRNTFVPQIDPQDGYYHWPSEFKSNDHKTRVKYMDGQLVDTRSGQNIGALPFGAFMPYGPFK